MSQQPVLFDPAETTPVSCPVGGCGAIRLPGQERVATCTHDLEPPDDRPYRRPRGCLNTYNPTTAAFPHGY